jgi:hypothetical protein
MQQQSAKLVGMHQRCVVDVLTASIAHTQTTLSGRTCDPWLVGLREGRHTSIVDDGYDK